MNIIPAHDNVDIDATTNYVDISQTIDGETSSVRLHKRYIPDFIAALEGLREQSDQDLMDAVLGRTNASKAA